MHQQLYLAYFDSRPDLSAFDVKNMVKQEFLGTEFTFRVIGDSHYIEAPEIEYYELFSCKPVSDETTVTIDLTVGEEENVVYADEEISTVTKIVGEPLSKFDETNEFDVKYKFGENAFTTIKCVNAKTYSTYHTYPEYNLALHSEHTLTTTTNDTKQPTTTNGYQLTT